MKRRLVIGGVLAAAGMLAAIPALASASDGAVMAVTHSMDHPDTTSVPNLCTGATSANGPVWAYDNLSRHFTVTPETGPGNYSVTITDQGSFSAIANPVTGACYSGHGSVKGTIQYDVQSSTGPTSLPPQEPGDVSTGATLSQLFGGNATIVGGGSYSYSYTLVDGSVYTQSG